MRVFSAKDALANLAGSTNHGVWYENAGPNSAAGLARNRVRRGILRPAFFGRVNLEPDAKIFCLGSCFARQIEGALSQRGFDVLSTSRELDAIERVFRQAMVRQFVNLYNPLAIRTTLRFAMGLEPVPPATLAKTSRGVVDLVSNPTYALPNEQQALRWRDIRNSSYRTAPTASLVALTLGHVETWRDNETGAYLNHRPATELIDAQPDRFDYCLPDYGEVVAALREVCDLIASPKAQLVITVSPIALQVTYESKDVVVASTATKSLLRAAADLLATTRPGTHYFPSYEMALLSDAAVTWDGDEAHVTDGFAQAVVATFLDDFLAGE